MKAARGRADARWLPSRHRFALSRLIAYLVFRRVGRRERPGLVLAIDRDQSAIENYAVGIWVALTTAFLFFGIFERLMTRAAAVLLAPIAALTFLQIFPVLTALGPRWMRHRDNLGLVSFVTMFATAVLAVYVAGTSGWARHVAWSFLVILLLNGAAAIVIRSMKGRFAAVEREAGVE